MLFPLINHKYKFICFWHPKCGCTFLKNWFNNLTDKLDYLKNRRVHSIITYHNYNASKDDILNKYKDYYKFIITRNPYDRMVSFYCNKIIHSAHIQLKPGQNSFPLIKGMSLTNRNCNMTFDELVDFLHRNRDKLKMFEPHLASQSMDLNNIVFDKIIDLKDMNRELINIEAHLKMPHIEISANDQNKTKYLGENPKMVNCDKPKNIPLDKIPVAKYFLTPENMKKIYEIYRNDFGRFGYDAVVDVSIPVPVSASIPAKSQPQPSKFRPIRHLIARAKATSKAMTIPKPKAKSTLKAKSKPKGKAKK